MQLLKIVLGQKDPLSKNHPKCTLARNVLGQKVCSYTRESTVTLATCTLEARQIIHIHGNEVIISGRPLYDAFNSLRGLGGSAFAAAWAEVSAGDEPLRPFAGSALRLAPPAHATWRGTIYSYYFDLS